MATKVRSLLITALFFFLLFTPLAPALAAGEDISVYIDGMPVVFDVKPVLYNSRTLVPFRALAEALDIQVTWDGQTRTVSASKDGDTIRLQIDSTTAYHNSAAVELEAPPLLINGRTLIPLRFFSETLGCKVQWAEATRSVKIVSPPEAMTVLGFYALGDSATSSWKGLFKKQYPNTETGNTDIVSTVALGWYSLDKEGSLLTKSRTGWQRPEDWEKVLEAAKKYSLKTEMVVHLTDGDGTLTALLADKGAREKAAKEIAGEAKSYNGVNLDFEGLGLKEQGEELTAVRSSFSAFVSQLASQLKPMGKSLTLSLHPPNSAYRGYDYRSLGELADTIVIMAYDYGIKPEPVTQVLQAVEMARASVPANKLVLGISAPGETAESVIAEVGIAKRYGLSGVALWRLGLVPGDLWEALRTTILVKK